MTARIDIRVERTEFLMRASGIIRHPNFSALKMHPPASGPEVELTFRFDEGERRPLETALLITTLYGMTPLAVRERARSTELRPCDREAVPA